MSEVHGKMETIFVSGADLAGEVAIQMYVDTSTFARTRALHEVTTKGNDWVRRRPGLRDSSYSIGGVYSNLSSSTPRTIFEENDSDEPFTFERRIEGQGAGLPRNIWDGFVSNYTESAPVGDMVRWTAEVSGDGPVDNEAQS